MSEEDLNPDEGYFEELLEKIGKKKVLTWLQEHQQSTKTTAADLGADYPSLLKSLLSEKTEEVKSQRSILDLWNEIGTPEQKQHIRKLLSPAKLNESDEPLPKKRKLFGTPELKKNPRLL